VALSAYVRTRLHPASSRPPRCPLHRFARGNFIALDAEYRQTAVASSRPATRYVLPMSYAVEGKQYVRCPPPACLFSFALPTKSVRGVRLETSVPKPGIPASITYEHISPRLAVSGLASAASAVVVTLGPSTQAVTFTGTGWDLADVLGSCVYDGKQTTCTVSARITGLATREALTAFPRLPGDGASPLSGGFFAPGKRSGLIQSHRRIVHFSRLRQMAAPP